jgi:hypothetical protein
MACVDVLDQRRNSMSAYAGSSIAESSQPGCGGPDGAAGKIARSNFERPVGSNQQ